MVKKGSVRICIKHSLCSSCGRVGEQNKKTLEMKWFDADKKWFENWEKNEGGFLIELCPDCTCEKKERRIK